MVRSLKLAALAFVAAFSCQATTIASISDYISASDSAVLGRLSRSGVPSDWSTAKAFPGFINTSTTYHYKTYNVAVDAYSKYLEFTVDDPLTSVFVSAYWASYDSANPSLNYLGDAGSSGNSFGNPGYFQVVVPGGGILVILANSSSATGADLGVGHDFGIQVDAYTTTDYESVPEPATIALAGGALALLAGVRKYRRAA